MDTHKGLVILFILLLIGAGVFLILGFNKMFSYDNSPYSFEPTNAYVGGDAYNYIINANYATGYFVLAGFCGIGAIGLLILRWIKVISEDFFNHVERKNLTGVEYLDNDSLTAQRNNFINDTKLE